MKCLCCILSIYTYVDLLACKSFRIFSIIKKSDISVSDYVGTSIKRFSDRHSLHQLINNPFKSCTSNIFYKKKKY